MSDIVEVIVDVSTPTVVEVVEVGPVGPQGADGAPGSPGPNIVTSTTATDLSGVLVGDSVTGKVRSAIPGEVVNQSTLDAAIATRAASVHGHVISDVTNLQSSLDAKQATLVSGTNIKTINGESLLGSGDLEIDLTSITDLLSNLRPVVLTQPTAVSGSVGDSLSISCLGGILPNTHLNLTYQWQLSTDAGVSYSDITGATSATIPFNPALFGQNGLYRCRLANAFGTQNTNAVALTVDNAIRHLYGVNDRGIAWDLDRMDHLWQNIAASVQVPVTAYGDPVSFAFTTERGGIDNASANLVTNGTFPTNTDWNLNTGWTISGGTLNASVATGFAAAIQAIPAIAINRAYLLSFDVTVVSGQVQAGIGSNGENLTGLVTASGSYTYVMRTPTLNGGANFYFRSGNGFTGSIDNVVLREVPGTHLIQTISLRRPTYARRPKSGVRNLLQRTEEFGNAYWAGTNITQSIATAIHLTATATNFVPTTTNGQHFVSSAVLPVLAGNTYTISVYVKADGYEGVALAFGASRLFANYNLATGTVTNSSSDGINMTGHSASIEAIGSGVFRLRMTGTAITSIPNVYSLRLGVSANPASSVHSGQTFVGDGISGVVFSAPQIEIGPAPTSYQRVTNQFDVTETGQPSINYLWFDGIDDCLVSATAIDFSNSDEMTVCVGYRTSSASQQVLAESELGAVNGLFGLYGWWNNGRPMFRAWGDFPSPTAPTPVPIEGSVIPLNTVTVLTGQTKLSNDSVSIRRNGLADGAATGELGNSNFVNRVVHIGARAGTSLLFNGHLNSGFIVNRILNPLVLADYEKYWVGVKAGVDL